MTSAIAEDLNHARGPTWTERGVLKREVGKVSIPHARADEPTVADHPPPSRFRTSRARTSPDGAKNDNALREQSERALFDAGTAIPDLIGTALFVLTLRLRREPLPVQGSLDAISSRGATDHGWHARPRPARRGRATVSG